MTLCVKATTVRSRSYVRALIIVANSLPVTTGGLFCRSLRLPVQCSLNPSARCDENLSRITAGQCVINSIYQIYEKSIKLYVAMKAFAFAAARSRVMTKPAYPRGPAGNSKINNSINNDESFLADTLGRVMWPSISSRMAGLTN